MARASRRTPRTPPTPGKARRLTPSHAAHATERSARTIDLLNARTLGEICARIAAEIGVPLRGEDDASALGRLAYALSNDPRPCTFLNLEALAPEVRRELDLWTARISRTSRRPLRPAVGHSNDLSEKSTTDKAAFSTARPAWRDPHLDLALRMVRGPHSPAPEDLRSALRLSTRAPTVARSSGPSSASPSRSASRSASPSASPPPSQASGNAIDDSLTELLALLPALHCRGPLSIELALLDEWLEAAQQAHADPWLRARTLMARGDALRLLGRLEEARIDLEEARSLARGEASLESSVIALLGRLHHHGARHEEAQMHYERALALAAESHDVALRIDTLLDLATLLRDTSQPRDALPYAERALALTMPASPSSRSSLARLRALASAPSAPSAVSAVSANADPHAGSAPRRARAAALVATLLHAEALHDDARAAYATAIDAANHAGEDALVASALANLGLLERQSGSPVDARDSLLRAAHRFARLGMAHSEARARLAAALVIVDVDAASAIESGEHAAALFGRDAPAADPANAFAAKAAIAFAHAHAGDRAAARAACADAFSSMFASAPATMTSGASARATDPPSSLTPATLATLVRARLLVADAAVRSRTGSKADGDALRRDAYEMYEATKDTLIDAAAFTAAPGEMSDANGAARSLFRSLERALSSRVTPGSPAPSSTQLPSDRPARTRRFF